MLRVKAMTWHQTKTERRKTFFSLFLKKNSFCKTFRHNFVCEKALTSLVCDLELNVSLSISQMKTTFCHEQLYCSHYQTKEEKNVKHSLDATLLEKRITIFQMKPLTKFENILDPFPEKRNNRISLFCFLV